MSRIVFVAGARGGGKSTLAREQTARAFRRVVIDPSGDWARRGVTRARTLQDVSTTIAQRWRSGFDVVYVPPVGKEAIELHRMSVLLFAYQEQLYRGREADEIMLVVDEMAEAYSNDDARRDALAGFRRVILQGRHYGISVCGISQRPQDVAARFRDNADYYFAFTLHSDTGRDAVLAALGKRHAAAYDSLQKFEYLAKHDGAVIRGKTRKT